MAGLGSIIGGALSGFGAGIAKQGEMDWQQRREVALEGLRTQNKQANMRVQAEEQRTTQKEKAVLDDKLNENENKRITERTIKVDTNRNALDTAKAERLAKVESELRRADAAAADALKRAAAAGEVSDTFQDEQGNWHVLFKNGISKALGVKGVPKTAGGTGSGGSILDRAGGAGGGQPATPGAKVSVSNW